MKYIAITLLVLFNVVFLVDIIIDNKKNDIIKSQSELIESQRSTINQLDSINDFLNTHKITRYTIIEKDTIKN